MANDVRVGSQHDNGTFVPWKGFGLQKVYPVGPWILAGFSGSVQLGFAALDDIQRYIGHPPDGVVVSPSVVARSWWRRMRRAWLAAPDDLRRLGLSVMVVGVAPADTPYPVSHGFVFRSPTFEMSRIKAWTPTGIGSGRNLPHVLEAMDEGEGKRHRERGVPAMDGTTRPVRTGNERNGGAGLPVRSVGPCRRWPRAGPTCANSRPNTAILLQRLWLANRICCAVGRRTPDPRIAGRR